MRNALKRERGRRDLGYIPVFFVVTGVTGLSGTSFALFSDRCLAVALWLKWCSAGAPMVASSPSTWLLASLSPLPSWWLAKCLVSPQPEPQFSALSISNKCLAREQRDGPPRSTGPSNTLALDRPLEAGWNRTFDSQPWNKNSVVT